MNLKFYNSISKKIEEFKPIDPIRITFYGCGPTIYAPPHLGNARAAIVSDLIFRVLRHQYGEDHVVYARNITDVDDKIITKSVDSGQSIETITSENEKIYLENMKALNVLEPTLSPHATVHISDMIETISNLLTKGFAYRTNHGVYFLSEKFDSSLGLASNFHEDLELGHRIEKDSEKINQSDFALWKFAEGPGTWNAPWGRGKVGWHTECVSMIQKHLGETIDIHSGGQDLRFPHHESEIAQGWALNKKPLANYWIHNGLLNINNKKMAKSDNNFITINEALEHLSGDVIRYRLLSTHYRSPLNWTENTLLEATANFNYISQTIENFEVDSIEPSESFINILLNDFNSPEALVEIHRLAKQINLSSPSEKEILQKELFSNAYFLGFFRNLNSVDILDKDSIILIDRRNEARRTKNWSEADVLRTVLDSKGITVKDTSTGSKWYKNGRPIKIR